MGVLCAEAAGRRAGLGRPVHGRHGGDGMGGGVCKWMSLGGQPAQGLLGGRWVKSSWDKGITGRGEKAWEAPTATLSLFLIVEDVLRAMAQRLSSLPQGKELRQRAEQCEEQEVLGKEKLFIPDTIYKHSELMSASSEASNLDITLVE